MLKQKPKGTSPLLDKGRPKLETVEVAPVDNILNALENVQEEHFRDEVQKEREWRIALLNRRFEEQRHHRLCHINCPCAPCLVGLCNECYIESVRSLGELEDKNMRWQQSRGINPYNPYEDGRDRDRARAEEYRQRLEYEQMKYSRYSLSYNFNFPNINDVIRIPMDVEDNKKW